MPDYSLGVALFDFVPVFFTVLALSWLALGVGSSHASLLPLAWTAVTLIGLGGLCKATWKLLIATRAVDVVWLDQLLFVLLAPGFIVMAFVMHHSRGSGPGASRGRLLLWLCVPLLGATMAISLQPDSRLWFFWLLAVTTVANAALLIHASLASRDRGLGWLVAGCFALNFIATLALSGLSRLPQGEATAWLQQSVNLFAQGALATGAWHLSRAMRHSA